MALTKQQKGDILKALIDEMKSAKSVVFADFQGLTVKDISDLRRKMRDEASVKIERLEEKLNKIKDWCIAYPVSIFPEPDFDKMAKVLKDNGMTIDSIGASSMRHVLKGIQDIINHES